MSRLARDTGVLVMAFGGPTALEEVEDFLRRFFGGRLPSRERIEEVKRRYRLIGGGSPLPRITLNQARGLEEELARRGNRLPVSAGFRFSRPSIEDAVVDMRAREVQLLVALPLTPYRSKLSTAPYFAGLREAMEKHDAGFEVIRITGWHTHPRFLEALEEMVREGLSRFAPEVRDTVQVIFSAHSLPIEAVSGDPYVEEIRETIKGLLERIGPLSWHLAFQSRGGGGSWLEPDVGDLLNDLVRKGCRRVFVVPMGFVSDHLETLYDLDIMYKKQAEKLGMEYERASALNDSPRFINVLADVVLDGLESRQKKGRFR